MSPVNLKNTFIEIVKFYSTHLLIQNSKCCIKHLINQKNYNVKKKKHSLDQ